MSVKRDRIKGAEGSWNNIKKRKRNIFYSASFSSSINIILFQPLLATPHFTHINYGIIRIMENIKIHQSKMKEKLGKNKEEREEKESGRLTLLTLELRSHLLKLFEENFFIAIVSAEAGIYRYHIYEWIGEREDFNTAIMQARQEWIEQLSERKAFIYPSVKNDCKTRIKEESKEGRQREKETGHRTTLLTPELRVKLIGLFEEHFFLWIVASKAKIYRQRIYEWENDQEDFRIDVTHARLR